MDLINELSQKIRELEICIKQLRKTGTEFAEAERNYKIILRQECLKLRDEGMAIGMIDKVCYGIQKVADARFDRDVKQTLYQANQDAIQSIKLQIRIMDSQISREYGVAGKGDL